MTILISYLHFFAAMVYLFLCLFIIKKNQSAMLNRICAAMLLCFFDWSLFGAFINNPLISRNSAIIFENLGSFGWIFFIGFFIWFSAIFCESKRLQKSRTVFISIAAISSALIYAQWTGQLSAGHVLKNFGWTGRWMPTLWTWAYFGYLTGGISFGLFLIWNYGRRTRIAVRKQQSTIILIASISAFILGFFSNVIFRNTSSIGTIPLADVYILVWVIGMVYAITRYQLLSITPVAAADEIVSSITDQLFLLDVRGTIVWANTSAQKTLGYEMVDLEGRPLPALLAETGAMEEVGRLIDARKNAKDYIVTFTGRYANRIAANLTLSFLKGGGILCVVRDISIEKESREALQRAADNLEKMVAERTSALSIANDDLTKEILDRKRFEEDLRDSEERLKVLFEFAPDAYFTYDLKGTFVDGNKKAEELSGYNREDLIGKNFLRIGLLPAAQIPKAIRTLVRSIAGESTGPDEFILNKNNGSQTHLEIISYPVVLKGMKIVLAMARDISSRRRAEATLRASEEKFRLTFENSHDAIIWLDPRSHVITHCNPASETLLDCAKDQIIGEKLASFYPVDKKEYFTTEFIRNIQKKRNFEMDAELFSRTGMTKVVRITTTAIIEGEQQLIQFVCHDITLQKQTEREKAHLEDQLRHSQKMEAIGRLAGGIAHDFNNVLGAISGYAEMIRHKFGTDNPKLDKYALTIFSAASRAADLTAKLLAFARKGKIELAVVSLHECIAEAVALLDRTLPKSVVLVQNLQANTSNIMGDRTQLQNAIINLSLNARDAMPNGGTLTITTSIVELTAADVLRYPFQITPDVYCLMKITDTGTGMDTTTKARLFEPFFTTKERGKGTGLGLASVYGTIKSHSGFIDVGSDIGKGTTFNIFLPLVAKQEPESMSDTDDTLPTGTGSILLVDDEEHIREIANEMLTDLGYTTQCAVNGEEALAIYTKNHAAIDLVILDIIMPKMNGYVCFQELRKINPAIKVIIASGYALDSETRTMMAQGALEFVQKPFDMKTIARAVKNAFEVTGSKKK
jgi:PAS domain S-box-containing protein